MSESRRFIHHDERPLPTSEQIEMWKTIGMRLQAAKGLYEQSPHREVWQSMSGEDWHSVSATDVAAVEELLVNLFQQTEEICREMDPGERHNLSPDAQFFPHLNVMKTLGDIYWDNAEGFRENYPPGTTKEFQHMLVLTHDLPRTLGFNGGVAINKGDDAISALVRSYFPNLPLKEYMHDAAVIWGADEYPSTPITNFWKLADTCGKPANGLGIRYPEQFLSPGGAHEQWQRNAIERNAFPLYLPEGRTYRTDDGGTTKYDPSKHGYWAVSGEYYGRRDREWTKHAYRIVSEQYPEIDFNAALEHAVLNASA